MDQVQEYNENYQTGWIKSYRSKFKHWISENKDYFFAWDWILHHANFEKKKMLTGATIQVVNRGQIIIGIAKFSQKVKMTPMKVRTFLKLLESDGMIERKTTNRYTILTICNYETYQDNQQTDNKQITNKQQTNNKQITTTKEVKNVKNVKNDKKKSAPASKIDFKIPLGERKKIFRAEIRELIGHKITREDAFEFFDYWSAEIQGTEIMLKEDQKTWNLESRIRTWLRKKVKFEIEHHKDKQEFFKEKRRGEAKISDIFKIAK